MNTCLGGFLVLIIYLSIIGFIGSGAGLLIAWAFDASDVAFYRLGLICKWSLASFGVSFLLCIIVEAGPKNKRRIY